MFSSTVVVELASFPGPSISIWPPLLLVSTPGGSTPPARSHGKHRSGTMVPGMLPSLGIGLLSLLSHFETASAAATKAPPCRYLPGDSGWPLEKDWKKLNANVSGKLIAVVPLGHVCHDPTYDAAACAALQAGWTLPQNQ